MRLTVSVIRESKAVVIDVHGRFVRMHDAAIGCNSGERLQMVDGFTAILNNTEYSWHLALVTAVKAAEQMAASRMDLAKMLGRECSVDVVLPSEEL